jgi:hypothetical protein
MVLKKTNLISQVMDLSAELMEDSRYVTYDEKRITEVAGNLKKKIDEQKEFWMGYPIWFEPEARGKKEIDYMLLSYELMAGAVNYQYWYATTDIRPNDSGATKMYDMLDESFELAGSIHSVGHRVVCEDACRHFIRMIATQRLPNAEKRIHHVQEILDSMTDGPNILSNMVDAIHLDALAVDTFLRTIVTTYPGFAGDMFLKRPFLVAMMLYRRVQWFKKDIHTLPIPADYQVPKMLRWLGCIKYSKELSDMISNDVLIPAGSLIEAEIRAATVEACKLLALSSGLSMCDVDTYLWLNRKQCTDKFHLTNTTDY